MAKPVLIIEDDPDIREHLKLLLSESGYSTQLAEHGKEGLEVLQKMSPPPGIILVDLMMPTMDGLTFLRQLRELKAPLKALPAALISAAPLSAERNAQVQALSATWIQKPFDIDRILTLVESHCG